MKMTDLGVIFGVLFDIFLVNVTNRSDISVYVSLNLVSLQMDLGIKI